MNLLLLFIIQLLSPDDTLNKVRSITTSSTVNLTIKTTVASRHTAADPQSLLSPWRGTDAQWKRMCLCLVLGICSRLFNLLTASLMCLGCRGGVSPHFSHTSRAGKNKHYGDNKWGVRFLAKSHFSVVPTFLDNLPSKHLRNPRHGDDHILRDGWSCDGLN